MPGWEWDGWFGEDPFPAEATVPDSGGDVGLDWLMDPAFGGGFADPFGAAQFNLFSEGGRSSLDQFGTEQLFYDLSNGGVFDARGREVMPGDAFQRSLEALRLAAQTDVNTDPTGWQRAWAAVDRAFAPINKFLGTPLGGTLGALGLGAVGIGVANLVAGGQGRFVPPSRTGIANNPAAVRLANEIRMRNLRLLNSFAPGDSADPVTSQMTERLQKALRGEVSNPVLERAFRDEDEELRNRFLRRGYTGEGIDTSSAGIERRGRLQESQSIRTYLDNLATIGQLEPAQARRLAAEDASRFRLSGFDEFGAQQRFDDDLALRLAYEQYLQDREGRRNLATQLGALFGRAGSLLGPRPNYTFVQGARGWTV